MVKYLVKDIDEGVKLLRLDDDRTRFFEAAWHIPEGITYNAYLIDAPGGQILVDTWKATYSDLLMEALGEVTRPGRIKYVIVNHAEPDHTGSLPAVLGEAREAKVIVNAAGEKVLRAKYRLRNEVVHVEGTRSMDLLGEEMTFIHVPWVHWPETMFTYQGRTGTLYTCDVFGSFSIPPGHSVDPGDARYLRSAEKYLITVMGYYRKHVLSAIERIDSLGLRISRIAPSHGGVWEGDVREPLRLYRAWAGAEPRSRSVSMAYVSMYGSIEAAASRIFNELSSRGIGVSATAITDSEYPDLEEFLVDANDASAIVLATPTYDTGVHPRMKFLLELMREKFRGVEKPVAAIVSYGWGSNAARYVETVLRETGMKVLAVETFRESLEEGQASRVADLIAGAIG
ncbi:FprA family A-type flavoprotein [Conexivisphaera calida]|uniref:Flavoprotein n=1 Tax=Conexivisphaera calida TaxID=1874277 RepID=A0A4P2VDK7_9ARCH|nr:FprA family A-type flavoprotein [Conexivisphaera calida]BBE42157.1 Flavoprotein [Conexivisphaera calida]